MSAQPGVMWRRRSLAALSGAEHDLDFYHGPDMNPIEQFLEEARNGPECFKCREPITEFNEVRVVTVRIDGKPKDVWMHASHRISSGVE